MQKRAEFEPSLLENVPPQGDKVSIENTPFCVSPDTWVDLIDRQARHILGGKGAEAIEMTRLEFPVPQFFVIPTPAWERFRENGKVLRPDDWTVIQQSLLQLEQKTKTCLGDQKRPLFVSARSSPRQSMPGQLITHLNLGLNTTTVGALGEIVGEEEAKRLLASQPQDYPNDPQEQIRWALTEVFNSWDSSRAIRYRQDHGIPKQSGPAAIIQQMAWGNSKKEGAGSGVFFPRHPQTYDDEPAANFCPHAQGPSVVGRDSSFPLIPISELPIPEHHKQQLRDYAHELNRFHGDTPYEAEITDDGAHLWFLQKRPLPLVPVVDFRYRRHQIETGDLTEHQAICAIPSAHLKALSQPTLDPKAVKEAEQRGMLIAQGIPISGGCAKGKLLFSLDEAEQEPENVVLSDPELVSFSNLPPPVAAVLQDTGGIGSHFAKEGMLLTQERPIPIVFSATVDRNYSGQQVTVDANSGDGNRARVYLGDIPYAQKTQLPTLHSDERQTAEEWLTQKETNPWRFLSSLKGIEEYKRAAARALEQIKKGGFQSQKAREYIVYNNVIPPKIRQQYDVYRRDTPDSMAYTIESRLSQIFKHGNHATIRTCHTPARPAGGPWVLIRSFEDFQQFLVDPHFSKYGGLQELLNPDLTELLVGEIPPGKMDDDNQEIQNQYAAWTLSCLGNSGLVVFQVFPHNAHLRTHEPKWKNGKQTSGDDLITFTTHYDPTTPDELSEIHEHVGSHLQSDSLAYELATSARDTIFRNWWELYQLPLRMAAISQALGANTIFEGQVNIQDKWCKGYGIKPK